MSLEDRSEWKQLLQEGDPGKQVYLGLRLADQLDTSEIAETSSLFGDSPDQKLRYLASGVLLYLSRKNHPKFSPELRSKVQAAAERLVKAEYPHIQLAIVPSSFCGWEMVQARSACFFLRSIRRSLSARLFDFRS